MNWNTRGTWLHGDDPETEAELEPVTINLPGEMPDWNDSTVYIQQIHEALVAKGWGGWGRGPI